MHYLQTCWTDVAAVCTCKALHGRLQFVLRLKFMGPKRYHRLGRFLKASWATKSPTFHFDLVVRWACGKCRDHLLVLLVPWGRSFIIQHNRETLMLIAVSCSESQCAGNGAGCASFRTLALNGKGPAWGAHTPLPCRAPLPSHHPERSDARELLLAHQPVPHRVAA